MGKIQYGIGEGRVSITLDDEMAAIIEEIVTKRFITGKSAGKPFRIRYTAAGDDVTLIVSAGVPLVFVHNAADDWSEHVSEIAKMMSDALEEHGLLLLPGDGVTA